MDGQAQGPRRPAIPHDHHPLDEAGKGGGDLRLRLRQGPEWHPLDKVIQRGGKRSKPLTGFVHLGQLGEVRRTGLKVCELPRQAAPLLGQQVGWVGRFKLLDERPAKLFAGDRNLTRNIRTGGAAGGGGFT